MGRWGKPTVMTPEKVEQARALAAIGTTLRDAAETMAVARSTLSMWAQAQPDVQFADGRKKPRTSEAFRAAARRNAIKAVAAARLRRLPLTPTERRRYNNFRDKFRKAGVAATRDDAFRAIGRDDLVGWGR